MNVGPSLLGRAFVSCGAAAVTLVACATAPPASKLSDDQSNAREHAVHATSREPAAREPAPMHSAGAASTEAATSSVDDAPLDDSVAAAAPSAAVDAARPPILLGARTCPASGVMRVWPRPAGTPKGAEDRFHPTDEAARRLAPCHAIAARDGFAGTTLQLVILPDGAVRELCTPGAAHPSAEVVGCYVGVAQRGAPPRDGIVRLSLPLPTKR